MIGDKLIYKPEHYKKCQYIIPKIMEKYFHNRLVIAIGGESGTGKTEIASLLQEALWEQHKIRVKTIHVDDYYKTLWLDRNKVRRQKGLNSVGKKEIDWKKLNKIIETFKSKQKYLYVQRIHRYTNSIEETKSDNRCIDILIVEGLYANYLENKDMGIYLEGSIKDTEKFRKERAKEKQTRFRYRVLRKEKQEVQKTKKLADIRIPIKIRS